jgi:decaprenyl-phosphate phosphoribosyltransferase
VKNLFVLAPLLFAQHLFDVTLLMRALLAFGFFSLVSSSVYSINDVLDVEQDRLHPGKRNRPVAAGLISPARAVGAGLVLVILALGGALLLSWVFALLAGGYWLLNLGYSKWLKRVAFLDVAVIATGFVLRVVAGAVAIEVQFSIWLILCTFCLACLLGLGKRYHELKLLPGQEASTRSALLGYSLPSLKIAEWILVLVTLISYAAYTVAPGTVAKFHTTHLIYTLPFPALGILRYLQLVERRDSRAPTDALVADWLSHLNLAVWAALVVWVLYR